MAAIEKSLLYSQIPRGGACHIMRGSVHSICTMGGTGANQEAEERRKLWARVFVVISKGRNGRGRISRLKIGWIE